MPWIDDSRKLTDDPSVETRRLAETVLPSTAIRWVWAFLSLVAASSALARASNSEATKRTMLIASSVETSASTRKGESGFMPRKRTQLLTETGVGQTRNWLSSGRQNWGPSPD